MAKEVGADRLGDFYIDGGKVRKRRDWRGVSDTLYDYARWLKIMMTLGKFVIKPRNVKAMFRYRWMVLDETWARAASSSTLTRPSSRFSIR